jgi:ElaB/YqjD/DUF883 family membrane-anchored ribosome-binding protein
MAYSRNSNDAFKDPVSSAAGSLSETASNIADIASTKIGQVVESAESTATAVAEQGREAGERVQEVAGNLKSAVNKSVKDQPMATLAVAVAMGFVIGALWKS